MTEESHKAEEKTTAKWNELLRYERLRRKDWLLDEAVGQLAKHGVNVDIKTFRRWEQGEIVPHPRNLEALCKLYGKKREQLGYPEARIPFWDIRYYEQNPFFRGREDILTTLHAVPEKRDQRKVNEDPIKLPPQALAGLAGVGKTQIAIEYAYRYMHLYHTIVWLRANEPSVLASDFAAIANLIKLPLPRYQQKEDDLIKAVKDWLKDPIITKWLLVFDNVSDFSIIEDFISSNWHGHIIITTQNQIVPKYIQGIRVEIMEKEEGANLLLACTEITTPSQDDQTRAQNLSEALGGLPLALAQAGAYINETGNNLASYSTIFQTRYHTELLQYKGQPEKEYPHTVATTWHLAFKNIHDTNPAASELLNFLAFLAPNIPEEIITENASILGPVLEPIVTNPIALDQAIKDLRKYSLIQRNRGNKSLTLHQLLQTVIKDNMEEETQREWAKCTVQAVNHIFPDGIVEALALCDKYLPHALVCTTLIEQWKVATPEAARLLTEIGAYLHERGKYKEVEPLFKRALAIRQQILNPDHLDILESLGNLAAIYNYMGLYPQAEALLKEKLSILDHFSVPDQNELAMTFHTLAFLHLSQGNYSEATLYYQRALDIFTNLLGRDHPTIVTTLNNLAVTYDYQEEYDKARSLLQEALSICKNIYKPEHPEIARCMNNLAANYRGREEYEQAEQLYTEALSMRERTLGSEHPDIANSFHGLGELYRLKKQYEKAEELSTKALTMREKLLGSDHIDVSFTLFSLAQTLDALGKHKQAEPYYERALTIREQIMGVNHPLTIEVKEGYASFLQRKLK